MLLISHLAFSQKFYGGITAGISASQIDGDEQAGYRKIGLMGGGFVGYPISQAWNAEMEFYYIGKGAVNNLEQADGTVFQEFKTHLNYIEMPFLICWQPFKRISFAGGAAASFLMSEKLYTQKRLIPEENYTMQNIDFTPMLRLEFFANKNLSINLRFSYSAFSIRKDFGWFNNNMSLAVRYSFKK